MEYENCRPASMMYGYIAVIIVMILLVFFLARREPAVGVRDGNWINGVYVRSGQ